MSIELRQAIQRIEQGYVLTRGERNQIIAELEAAQVHKADALDLRDLYSSAKNALAAAEKRAEEAERERDRLKAYREQFPLMDAKWLDPACHKGCQSLVLKQRLAQSEAANAEETTKLLAQLGACKMVLRDVEWTEYWTHGVWCPCCHQNRMKGHADDCTLAVLLKS